jgi:OPA family glycerol-3-phosphate transporter-like MFS transporter
MILVRRKAWAGMGAPLLAETGGPRKRGKGIAVQRRVFPLQRRPMSSTAVAALESDAPRPKLPPGYRQRRGLNWGVVGLLYTSFYMCRYNLSLANKSIADEFGFTKSDMSDIISSQLYAYAIGQVINGLLTDRLGGKKAMLIGAAGTIVMNLAFGAASFWGMLWLFVLLRGFDGYSQSFGAPGFIKINTSWFSQKERGTFAGIFGFMINLGRLVNNWLAPSLLAGFVFLGMWHVPPLHWRWLFWVPAGVATLAAIALAIFVQDTPEEAGFHGVHKGESDHEDLGTRAEMSVVFKQIVSNRFVWIIAAAYSCTGAVRQTVDQWFPRYLQEVHHMDMKSAMFQWTGFLIPFVASAGSLISGIISDRLFGGRRAPVAMGIYCIELVVILIAAQMRGPLAIAAAFVAISFTVNSTHSLLGPAAAMDIGGRKMAAFASGCINSFQYVGAGLAIQVLGRLLDRTGYTYFFYYMIPFAIVGAILMYSISHHVSLKKEVFAPQKP